MLRLITFALALAVVVCACRGSSGRKSLAAIPDVSVDCRSLVANSAIPTPRIDATPDHALQQRHYDAVRHYFESEFKATYDYCVRERGSLKSGALVWTQSGLAKARLDVEEKVGDEQFGLAYIVDGADRFLCAGNLGEYFQAMVAPALAEPTRRAQFENSDESRFTKLGASCQTDNPQLPQSVQIQMDAQFYSRFSVPRTNSIDEYMRFAPETSSAGVILDYERTIAGLRAQCYGFRYGNEECYGDNGELLLSRTGEDDARILIAVSVASIDASAFDRPFVVSGPTPDSTCPFDYYKSPDPRACSHTPTPREVELATRLIDVSELPGSWAPSELSFEPATCGSVFGVFDQYLGRAKRILERDDNKLQQAEEVALTAQGTAAAELAKLRDTTTTCKNQVGILIGAGLPDPTDLPYGDGGFSLTLVHEKLGTRMEVVVFRKGDAIAVLRQVARLDTELDPALMDQAVRVAVSKLDAASP